MAPTWAFIFVIFAFPGICQSEKPHCPNNRTYQCVPAPSCRQNLGSIIGYRCSKTSEVCCERQKVNTGVQNTGQSEKPHCPNNKIYQCVPAPSCRQNLGSITAYRCSSRTEVCCERQKVYTGVQNTSRPVKPHCPNNKIYQCVPTPYCRQDVGSITAYRCASTTKVCCEEQKVIFGLRYTGSKYVTGPYNQDP